MESESIAVASPWPHRWAWALACATFPLVWWGGFVTATGSGMAFREWLRPDGHFLLTYPWLSSTGDKFIEHGHRLLGALAGLLTIGLLAVVMRCETRRWVRRLGLVMLLAVIGQGALGGLRVVLDQRTLALLHGCTGPAFFALCAAMVVVTSPKWRSPSRTSLTALNPRDMPSGRPSQTSGRLVLTRFALMATGFAYLQLVFGALVRHGRLLTDEGSVRLFRHAVQMHVAFAFVVVGAIAYLAIRCLKLGCERRLAVGLASLVAAQFCLGLASWLAMYGQPAWVHSLFGEWNFVNVEASALRASLVTAHGAVGALILALSLALALRIGRSDPAGQAPSGQLAWPLWKGAPA